MSSFLKSQLANEEIFEPEFTIDQDATVPDLKPVHDTMEAEADIAKLEEIAEKIGPAMYEEGTRADDIPNQMTDVAIEAVEFVSALIATKYGVDNSTVKSVVAKECFDVAPKFRVNNAKYAATAIRELAASVKEKVGL